MRSTGVVKDPRTGEVVEVRATYDPATRGGDAPDRRRVKGTIHWVSAEQSVAATVRLYDRLFTTPNPGEAEDWVAALNPASLTVLEGCRIEPALANAPPGTRFQFERTGYFCADPDSRPDRPVFNRTVPLRDSWARIERAQA